MQQLEDGIYFDLPMKIYHAQHRLGSSGLSNMMISPGTFWADSWFNPDKKDKDENEDDTPATRLGRAYHDARFEPEIFRAKYMRKPTAADYGKSALTNSTQVGEALAALGLTKKKSGESSLEQAKRLREAGYGGVIWALVEDEYAQHEADGITLIEGPFYDQLVKDISLIRDDEEISQRFVGGVSEVSILWTDEKTGVPCKARVDYLKSDEWTDLKTFENGQRKALEKCLIDQFMYNRQYIQAVHYWRGVEVVRAGKLAVREWSEDADIPMSGVDVIQKIKKRSEPLEAYYVFQEKKGIPNLIQKRIKVFAHHASYDAHRAGATEDADARAKEANRRKSAFFMKAELEIDHVLREFSYYAESFPDGRPWKTLDRCGVISDESFSPYWLEA